MSLHDDIASAVAATYHAHDRTSVAVELSVALVCADFAIRNLTWARRLTANCAMCIARQLAPWSDLEVAANR